MAPSDVISMIATVQSLSMALERNFWSANLPGMLMRRVFDFDVSPSLVRSELSTAVVWPSSSKMALMNSVVLVLPLVPVTPMTVMRREGRRKMTEANHAQSR